MNNMVQTTFSANGKVEVNAVNSNGFNDPAFANNKKEPIHRWVPWIAGFSKDFVKDAIEKYLCKKGKIIDPFAGVGTTLIEANIKGHDSVGFEINPYAVLASSVKVNSYKIDTKKLQKKITEFSLFYREKIVSDYIPQSKYPDGFKTKGVFYSHEVLQKVLVILDFQKYIDDVDIKNIFKISFASTMIRYSNYSYEPSLGRRESAGKEKIVNFPVGEYITEKLYTILQDIQWYQKKMTQMSTSSNVINDSFFNYKNYLENESIDLLITSPPYLNNYHYNRNTRPQLYWLNYISKSKEMKALEQNNFGKYWQTVRGKNIIELNGNIKTHDLINQIDELRNVNKEKGIYGGNGWANYAASYFNDCYRFAVGIESILKKDSHALIVLGNSILQGIMFPTDYYFGKIAESIGLELVNIDIPRLERVGNSIIKSEVRVNKAKKGHHLYESIVVLKKL